MIFISRAQALAFLKAYPSTAGICRQCGCTHQNACRFLSKTEGRFMICGWTDYTQTLCTNPACVAQVEPESPEREFPAPALEDLDIAGASFTADIPAAGIPAKEKARELKPRRNSGTRRKRKT